MPPMKVDTLATLMAAVRPPNSVPELVMPPAKVETVLTPRSTKLADIVPELVTPPEKAERPWTRTPKPRTPPVGETIAPELVMPPAKVDRLLPKKPTIIPAPALPAARVPALVMPPEKVGPVTSIAWLALTILLLASTVMPCVAAMRPLSMIEPAIVVPAMDIPVAPEMVPELEIFPARVATLPT